MNLSPPFDLNDHPYFEAWTDPQSGALSFILNQRVAFHQQSFYFVNSGLSADGRYLWFYAAFPPSRKRTLGVVCLDPAAPMIRHYPESQFLDASPLVDPAGDGVYYCEDRFIYRQPLEGSPEVVFELSQDYLRNRFLYRFATHLTISSDGRHMLFDGEAGDVHFVGLGDFQTGKTRILREFDRRYNHAQFAKHDPERYIIAQDWCWDHATGEHRDYEHRIWLGDIHNAEFITTHPEKLHNRDVRQTHEWWSEDDWVCWVDYDGGVFELNPATGEENSVWPRPLCHAYCDSTRTYYCADQNSYVWRERPCEVLFFNRRTGKTIPIAAALPFPEHRYPEYHIDPHPRFSPDDAYVQYTTTIRGRADVALAPVSSLIALTE